VRAEVEEERLLVLLDRAGGHHAALDLAADEGEGEVSDARAELRGDALVVLIERVHRVELLLRVEELVTA
jgi:hypothetical protein